MTKRPRGRFSFFFSFCGIVMSLMDTEDQTPPEGKQTTYAEEATAENLDIDEVPLESLPL